MNGVTGRMGTNQHLVRSIVAIRDQGGVRIPGGGSLVPDPILLGRNGKKLEALARAHGIARWSTDLTACLANPDDTIYFDAQTTSRRAASLRAAMEAGKHVYAEKPVATSLTEALKLVDIAGRAGVKNGVVQDKLFLPGLMKLKRLIDGGFFGKILSVRGEFGYWVFEGDWQPAQRPSWNYRKEDGGGIIVDMLCHWRYVLDNLFGRVKAVSCLGACHIPARFDEEGKPVEPAWPEAEVIVGNPPFLGGNKIRQELGDKYVEALFQLFNGRVPAFADLVCYWFEKAHAMICNRHLDRAGLLATQAIRGGVNRSVLSRIKQDGDIFFAYSDRNWVLDLSLIHISEPTRPY